MTNYYWVVCLLVFSCLFKVCEASAGDSDHIYRACVRQCEKTGCAARKCFSNCNFSPDDSSLNGLWYTKNPFYLKWKQWDCESDCRYHCMVNREKERTELGLQPVKFNGKWPLQRVLGFEEPVSVALSVLNLAMHFHCWRSFSYLLYFSLPLRRDKKPFYDYVCLWNIYGLFAMNSWFWRAVLHSRDTFLTKNLDYSSTVALLGYSLFLAILRSSDIKNNAARVMVAAPLIAFTTTHILYLNNYELDYEWNMKVCVVMTITQLLTWTIWVGVTRHPSRLKLWTVVAGSGFAMFLQTLDFPPYKGFVDARALWHAAAIPLTYMWWSFIKDDAEFRTANLLKKVR